MVCKSANNKQVVMDGTLGPFFKPEKNSFFRIKCIVIISWAVRE